jgi:hypothetical protein
MAKPIPPLECAVADLTRAQIIAIQALVNGAADAEQQKRALDAIINPICRTYDLTYRPGGDTHASAFAAGRSFAGQQIVQFLKTNARLLKE